MTTEKLDWLEKVNIIVKKWTIGKVLGGLQLGILGRQLTLFLEPGECEDERDVEIIIADKWTLQPATKKFSTKTLLPIFHMQRNEYHHRNEHFMTLCDMFGSPEITDASIAKGGHLLLTFGNDERLCIDGAPKGTNPEKNNSWKIITAPYKLYAYDERVGGFWDPYDLRDEIKDNKAESQ